MYLLCMGLCILSSDGGTMSACLHSSPNIPNDNGSLYGRASKTDCVRTRDAIGRKPATADQGSAGSADCASPGTGYLRVHNTFWVRRNRLDQLNLRSVRKKTYSGER
ncbi:hypothetical protein FOPE_09999 [Fonsecaea pedrosoi]|nr:hypothetical protein FOPE_09999 [Fonsecaea pedrosoi]